MSGDCVICGDSYDVRPECEPCDFCDQCALNIIETIAPMVPKPPQAVTWEQGNAILTALQNEIWPARRLQREYEETQDP